ncbi:MAG: hypothetical protein KF814_06730 [Nitrospiraceae bacterium]|nr:hypothetical protein [Nitrospiraceae bacterium]
MVQGNGRCGITAVMLLLCLMGGGAAWVPGVRAEEATVDANSPDAIRQTLDQQQGKRVKVKLVSGQDLDGKVAKVGTHVLVLSELSGMEFFDATVRLDQVAAVIVRRSK